MPSEELKALVDRLRSRPVPAEWLEGLVTGTRVAEMRAAAEAAFSQIPVPEGTECERVDAGGVPAEWIIAPNALKERVICYLHGGAYWAGSVNTHRAMISRLSRAADARALAIDYRLAPEYPFPAAVDDATAAYRWLIAAGVDPGRLVVAGDSAGGGLTVATLVASRDAGDPLPAAAVCISPWVDLEALGESMVTNAASDPMVRREDLLTEARAYLRDADPREPLAAPLYADLRGLPALLIQVGTAEVLLDDSTRLAERARSAGVDVTLEPWEDMIHVWHLWARILPEGQQAIDRIGEFIQEHTG